MTAANRALAAALRLAGDGFAVYPVGCDKRPACPHGFKDAVTEVLEVASLWELYPAPLVGVACGLVSHLVVLDIDCTPQAKAWWLAHRGELPQTRVHRTRSGGLHCLFADGDGIRRSVGRICRGVDVLGEGGGVIWWPATGCRVLRAGPLAPWPEFLTELARPPPPPPLPVRRAVPLTGERLFRKCKGIARAVAAAAEGERNAVLYWGARRARDMVLAGELEMGAASALADTLHEAARQAGLPYHEITDTIRSALRAEP